MRLCDGKIFPVTNDPQILALPTYNGSPLDCTDADTASDGTYPLLPSTQVNPSPHKIYVPIVTQDYYLDANAEFCR